MICKKCSEDKDKSMFTKNLAYCKQCDNERAVEYRRSLKGRLIQMYNDQLKNCKNRNHSLPSYTKDEFLDYMLNYDKYLELHKNWKDSMYKKELSPSIDRIDEYSTYSFENIQVVTWAENNNLAYKRRKNGDNNKQSRIVGLLDSYGNIVEVFHSINEAGRKYNLKASHISEVCYCKRKQAGGYKWVFLSDIGHKNIKI